MSMEYLIGAAESSIAAREAMEMDETGGGLAGAAEPTAAVSAAARDPLNDLSAADIGCDMAGFSEHGMSALQLVTPGMWTDATVRSDKALIAGLEAHARILEDATKTWRSRAKELSAMLRLAEASTARLKEENARLIAAAASDAKPDGGPKADYHGPKDIYDPGYQAHKSVHDATEHLLGGRVTNAQARRQLRDALDKAEAPATGRKASDQGVGRAVRFGF